jgi:hypothetical protein
VVSNLVSKLKNEKGRKGIERNQRQNKDRKQENTDREQRQST